MSKLTNLVKGRGSNIAGNKRMHHDLSVYDHEDLLRTNKVHVRCEKTCEEDSFDDERVDPTFTPSCKRRKCSETSIKTQPRRVGSLRGWNPSASKKSNTLHGPSSSLYDDYNPFRQDFPCWPSRKRTHVDRPKAKKYVRKDASITINGTTVRCPLAFLPKDHFNPKKRKVNTYLFVLTSLALSLENKKVDSMVEEASLFSEADWSAVEALYSMKRATPVPDERIAVEEPLAMEAMEEVSAPAIVPAKSPEPFTPAQRKIEASELQSTGTVLDFADVSSSKIIDSSALQKEESKCETANEIIPIVVDGSESKPKVYEVYRRKYKVASQEPQPFKPDISKVVASQEPQPSKPDIFKVAASKKPQRSKPDVFKVYSSRSKVLRLERLYRRFNIGLLSNLS